MGRPSTLAIRVTSDSRQARQDIQGAGQQVEGTLSKLKSAGPALAGAAGAAIGGAIIAAFGKAMEQGKITAKLGAQLGATPEEAKKYGKIAGSLYSKGITDDFQGAADAISATMRSGLAPPGATNAQIESIATKASDLATTFDQETSQVTRAVSQMLKTGIAKNSQEAFDTLTRGFQTGVNAADDLLDTFSEYSTQFRDMGLNSKSAMGLLSQGLKGGARDADVVADALKELNIRVKDKTAAEGLKTLGLNADEMSRKFATGGPEAAKALDQILDSLNAIQDPSERTRIAVALLGTQAEDMAGALFGLDPSTAVKALGDVKGSSDKLGSSLRDNAGAALTSFQRKAEQKLVNFLGEKVIPALANMYRWWNDNISPAITKVGGLYADYLQPILEQVRAGCARVSKAVKDNSAKWQPLYDLLKKVAPIAGKVAGVFVGSMFDALVTVIGAVSTLVDWLSRLIGWLKEAIKWISKLKAPGWLSKLGDLVPFSATRAQAEAAGRSLAAPRAQALGAATFAVTTPVIVNVQIDGQQLQGRISRTVRAGLQNEGARYLAGGWV
ncbi:phage tail tape measure protein [Streptomyces alboflavus]|uniref:phage tail tape measure protein n=1 Tax=Streptomyces alboflavus TaxID=67267 RepID=UPI0036CE6462